MLRYVVNCQMLTCATCTQLLLREVTFPDCGDDKTTSKRMHLHSIYKAISLSNSSLYISCTISYYLHAPLECIPVIQASNF